MFSVKWNKQSLGLSLTQGHNFKLPLWKKLLKILSEKEKMLITSIFSFYFFASLPADRNQTIWTTYLSSKNAFNLTLLSAILTSMRKKAYGNLAGKGENAGTDHFLLCPKCFLPNWRQFLSKNKFLDWFKQQFFILVQIESICWQNKSDFKTGILFKMGRKHCGKRRKCWLPAFSLFPTIFLNGCFLRVILSLDFCYAFTSHANFRLFQFNSKERYDGKKKKTKWGYN